MVPPPLPVQPVPMHRRLFGGEIVPNIQPVVASCEQLRGAVMQQLRPCLLVPAALLLSQRERN